MMFRKTSISLLIAVTALLVFAVAVSAQGRWDGAGPNRDGMGIQTMRSWRLQEQNTVENGQPYQNRLQDGTCVNFVDEDGDGICDNAGTGAALGRMGPNERGSMSRGGGMNRGAGTGVGLGADGEPQHQFGDGVCDYETPPRDGTGSQYGR